MSDKEPNVSMVALGFSAHVDRAGHLVQMVFAAVDGTQPSCWIEIHTAVDSPNAYPEWISVSSILTEEFTALANEAMSESVIAALDHHPEIDLEELSNEVYDAARISGFSEEQAHAIAQIPKEGHHHE